MLCLEMDRQFCDIYRACNYRAVAEKPEMINVKKINTNSLSLAVQVTPLLSNQIMAISFEEKTVSTSFNP